MRRVSRKKRKKVSRKKTQKSRRKVSRKRISKRRNSRRKVSKRRSRRRVRMKGGSRCRTGQTEKECRDESAETARKVFDQTMERDASARRRAAARGS
jgi:hypothetical protein